MRMICNGYGFRAVPVFYCIGERSAYMLSRYTIAATENENSFKLQSTPLVMVGLCYSVLISILTYIKFVSKPIDFLAKISYHSSIKFIVRLN